MGNIKSTHIKIKEYLSSFDRVSNVFDVLESPDEHGDNASMFSAKYDQIDEYTYKKLHINIEWDRNIIFIPDVGYIPFESYGEIIKQIDNILN